MEASGVRGRTGQAAGALLVALIGFALPAAGDWLVTRQGARPPAPPPPSPAPAAPAKPAIVLTDEAGLPAPDREWRGADYARAAQVLANGTVPLPRLSEAEGAALFQRMTSTANFSFHQNRSNPIQARIEDYVNIQQGASSLLKLYYAAATKGQGFNQELAHVLGFLLHVSALGVELVDEFIPTLPKDDKYEVRMDGFRLMSSGLMTLFEGAEETLSESNLFSPEELSVILDAMARTLPRVQTIFTPDYRIKLRQKLQADKARFTQPADVQNIDAMLRQLGS